MTLCHIPAAPPPSRAAGPEDEEIDDFDDMEDLDNDDDDEDDDEALDPDEDED